MQRLWAILGLALVLCGFAGAGVLGDDGAVQEWLVCGPHRSSDARGDMEVDYLGGEEKAFPEQDGFGGGWPWVVASSDESAVLDLRETGWEPSEFAVAYAAVYLLSPEARPARLEATADEGLLGWVNGGPAAFSREVAVGTAVVDFRKGWNRLLFKVENTVLDWRLRVRILDLQGNPAVDCRTSLTNAASENEVRANARYPRFSVQKRFNAGEFFIGPESTFRYRCDVEMINLGSIRVQNGEFDLPEGIEVAGYPGRRYFALPELVAGEGVGITLELPGEEMLRSVLEGRPWIISTGVGEANQTTAFRLGSPETILAELTSGAWIEDWRTGFGETGRGRPLPLASGDVSEGRVRITTEVEVPHLLKPFDLEVLWRPDGEAEVDEVRVRFEGEPIGIGDGDAAWSFPAPPSLRRRPGRFDLIFSGVGRLHRAPLALAFDDPDLKFVRNNLPILRRLSFIGETETDRMTRSLLEGILSGSDRKFREAVETVSARVQQKVWEVQELRVFSVTAPFSEASETSLPPFPDESVVRRLGFGPGRLRDSEGRLSSCYWNGADFDHGRYLPELLRKARISLYFYRTDVGSAAPFHWKAPNGRGVLAYPIFDDEGMSAVDRAAWAFRETGRRDVVVCRGSGRGSEPTPREAEALPQFISGVPGDLFEGIEGLPIRSGEFSEGFDRAGSRSRNAGWGDEPGRFVQEAVQSLTLLAGGGTGPDDFQKGVLGRLDLSGPGIPLVVVNLLPWPRTGPVAAEVAVPEEHLQGALRLTSPEGETTPGQILAAEKTADGPRIVVAFLAEEVPAAGYRVYRLTSPPGEEHSTSSGGRGEPVGGRDRWRLKNGLLSIEIGTEVDGPMIVDLSSADGASVLKSAGPKIPDPQTGPARISATILEEGPVRSRIRFEVETPGARNFWEALLWEGVSWVEIQGAGGAFEATGLPVWSMTTRFESERAVEGIPFGWRWGESRGADGAVRRWLSLSDQPLGDEGRGLGILMEAGAPYRLEQGRLTLYDRFPRRQSRFALLPHSGGFRTGEVVRRSWEYAVPLIGVQESIHDGDLPPEASLFRANHPGVLVTALKPSESGKGVVVRLVEAHGEPAEMIVGVPESVRSVERVGFSEQPLESPPLAHGEIPLSLEAGEIVTLLLTF